MADVLSQTFGRPGGPGGVEVLYEGRFTKGCTFSVEVGTPGTGGKGGLLPMRPMIIMLRLSSIAGGAGGGRENRPLINAFVAYAMSRQGTKYEPLYSLVPGLQEFTWPYDTSTDTIVLIQPGGGMGEIVAGQDGQEGLMGAAFIFPTYILAQNPEDAGPAVAGTD